MRNDVVQGVLIGFGLAFVTAQIYARIKATKVNGWITMFGLGEPGNGMLLRAAHAQLFPGPVNVPQEAMYWWTNADGAGHTLSGEHDYIMHFPPGGLPPNKAFWSLTMGDCEKSFCAKSDQSLQRQRSFRPRAKPGRFGRHLHSEHRSGRSRVELAARALGQFHTLAARVHTRRGHSPWRVYGAAGCRGEMMHMEYEHLLIFGGVCVATWCLVIYFWPRMLLYVYKRAILVKGFGDGPIPVNTLYTEPQKLFAEPLASQTASSSNLMTVGVNHDTLATVGWLDLSKGPQVLHVPDMADRYYSVQFTDPSKNTNFAYVGKRTTGTAGRRLPRERPRLERSRAAGNVADIRAEQLGACPRPRPRGKRQRSPNRLWPGKADPADPTKPITSLQKRYRIIDWSWHVR